MCLMIVSGLYSYIDGQCIAGVYIELFLAKISLVPK